MTLVPSHTELLGQADICMKVNPPSVRDGKNELALVPEGSTFISFVGALDRFETEAQPKTEHLKDLQLARDRYRVLLNRISRV